MSGVAAEETKKQQRTCTLRHDGRKLHCGQSSHRQCCTQSRSLSRNACVTHAWRVKPAIKCLSSSVNWKGVTIDSSARLTPQMPAAKQDI